MFALTPRKNAMPKYAPAPSTFNATLCVALVTLCALAVFAQSGRRARKSEAMPIPIPEATPLPTPTEKPKPAFTFIVGLDRYSESSSLSLNDYSGVLRSCAGRLNDSASVSAVVSTRDMSRGEAIKTAKAEKEAYVVWLQLRVQSLSGRRGDPNDVSIEYWVFAPITAKVATWGNTYPGAYRNRGIRLPSSTGAGDYYLNQAARGAAERILDHFYLRTTRSW
jgi:hypothetical protein